MIDLTGKSVLFIAPKFFGYDADIAAELRARGAQVDTLVDRPFKSAAMTATTRFARKAVLPRVDHLYREQLRGFDRSHYDIVLVVNGQTLSSTLLGELRASYPRADFRLYMWDSMRSRPSALKTLSSYDVAFSFDRSDAQAHGLNFRPLFFSRSFEYPPNPDFTHHISFIGTAHTDRAPIVAHIDAALPAWVNRYWHLIVQAPWVDAAYRILDGRYRAVPRRYINFKPLDRQTVGNVFRQSSAILDIHHPGQTGLTMRTLEAFGSSKKLITTNRDVTAYDYYDPRNTIVIDRRDPVFPTDFLQSPYTPPSAELYAKYSISGWLDEVLGKGAAY